MGLLDSQNGVISLKGNIGPINDKGRFRDYIGYVSQDSFLFRGKISENITCFNDSNKDQLEKVLYIADCEDFINKLPDGVESELGDRGLGFSGGQVQRVCIARALYKGGDILILDEATSALDPITEQKVLKSITTEYPDKIIIFLTHRLKSLDYADRVLFLEQGEVKGEGTLDSLLKENRSFERFYNRQE
jgi:ATP-binding cassette subfamily B protein